MSIADLIAPQIPLLRRYARALTGAQDSGDACVLAWLEGMVAEPSRFDRSAPAREESYRLFSRLWNQTPLTGPRSGVAAMHDRRLEAITPLLEKMPPESRAALIAEAAKKCLPWPPRLDSAEGWSILMGSDEGNIALILEGLRAADPKVKPDDARRLFATLDRVTRRGNPGLVARVVGCIFGRIDPNEEAPKTEAEGQDESTPPTDESSE